MSRPLRQTRRAHRQPPRHAPAVAELVVVRRLSAFTLKMRLLDSYQVLLLDMNGTFMFGEDRFGPEQDFYATYRALGGSRMNSSDVTRAVLECYAGMLRDSRSPEHINDFPSVAEGLRCYARTGEDDVALLEAVFAAHELGSIPPEYSKLLQRLSSTHQLGLVSNIWARKAPWLHEFARAGLADIFSVLVFSSDSRSIKPSLSPFRQALSAFSSASRVLFIGNSLKRDIAPAKSLGLDTAWIHSDDPSPLADYVVCDLLAIEVA
jgi:putative hydrolase of the HAD superfamily